MPVADRIKQVIEKHERGNVTAAARKLGFSPSGLKKICSGQTSSPGSDLLEAIVREYGVDPSWLLLGEDSSPSEQRRIHREAIALIREMLEELDSPDRQ